MKNLSLLLLAIKVMIFCRVWKKLTFQYCCRGFWRWYTQHTGCYHAETSHGFLPHVMSVQLTTIPGFFPNHSSAPFPTTLSCSLGIVYPILLSTWGNICVFSSICYLEVMECCYAYYLGLEKHNYLFQGKSQANGFTRIFY